MKKPFETPVIEKIEFGTKDQILASGITNCKDVWVNIGTESCTDDNAHWEQLN